MAAPARFEEIYGNYMKYYHSRVFAAGFCVLVGGLAVAGLVTNITAGVGAIALSGSFLCSTGLYARAAKKLHGRANTRMVTAAIIHFLVFSVLGSLTIAGVIPPTIMGGCMIASPLNLAALINHCCPKSRKQKGNQCKLRD